MSESTLEYEFVFPKGERFLIVRARGELNKATLEHAIVETVTTAEDAEVSRLLIDAREVRITGTIPEIVSAARSSRYPEAGKLNNMKRVILVSEYGCLQDLLVRVMRSRGQQIEITTDEDHARLLCSKE
ncbi:MAG: hypothetical protein WD492_13040 [Alkalispirochaeta sp.]